MQIQIVNSKSSAEKVYQFLISKKAFDLEMTAFGKRARKNALYESIDAEKKRFWYILNEQDICIGAIGVAENERENGGYYLDYFAVHTDYRNKGIGLMLLDTAEHFVKEKKGRFILIDTGDKEVFKPARLFYEKHGYKKVSFIPDYYNVGDSRIDYYKKII